MKKVASLFTLIFVFFCFSSFAQAEYLNNKKIILRINGAYLIYSQGVLPFIDANNRMLVPARILSDALNGNINWNSRTKTLSLQSASFNLKATLNQKTCVINGKEIPADTALTIKNGTTLIPLRWVSDALKAQMGYDHQTGLLSIDSIAFFEKGKLELLNYDSNKDEVDTGIVPIRISYGLNKEYNLNFLNISFKNYSNITFAKGELQDHLFVPVNKDNNFDIGSKGEIRNDTSSIIKLGPIQPKGTYKEELHIKEFEKLDPGPAQYAFIRYFKKIDSK
jgi:hypothetical protein